MNRFFSILFLASMIWFCGNNASYSLITVHAESTDVYVYSQNGFNYFVDINKSQHFRKGRSILNIKIVKDNKLYAQKDYEYTWNFRTEEWMVNNMPLASDVVGQAAWNNYGQEARLRAVHEMDRAYN